MRKRIFIAINLPENIKKELVSYQEKIEKMFDLEDSLPIRWTEKENLHITLAFLGYLSDQELSEICKILKTVSEINRPFSLTLNKIYYGPPGKPPKMIWVAGEKSKELGKIQRDLENSLERKISGRKEEARPFSSHITLGRLKQWQFRKINPEERPYIYQEFSLIFDVPSIEIMESKLKPSGPGYFILESFGLGSK